MKRLSSLLLLTLLLAVLFPVGVPCVHADVQDRLPLTLIDKEGFSAIVTSVDASAQGDRMLAVGLHLVGTEAGAEVSLNRANVNGWTLGYEDFEANELRSAYLDANGLDATVYILSAVKDSFPVDQIDTVEFSFQIRSLQDGQATVEKGTLILSEAPLEAPISLRYESRLFFDDWNMTTPICLSYSTNRTSMTALVTLAVTAFEANGEPISVFDMMRGVTRHVNQFSLCVPAGVEDYPIAFRLPSSYTYDPASNTPLPAIDHLECEVVGCKPVQDENLVGHFTAGEVTVDKYNIRMPLVFDETIANGYTDIFANYTLIGRTGDTIVFVSCREDYPYSTSSWSVTYAVNNDQNYLQVYLDAPREDVAEWSFYPGFIGGK